MATVRRRAYTALLSMGWWCFVFASAEQRDARDLTVQLFSTRAVSTLSIGANQTATMRLCRGCKEVWVPADLQVQKSQRGSQLLVEAKPATELALAGQLRLKTADGRTAEAAGKWLVRAERGSLHVQLTLPSERYVMAVLQSEAGPDDGPEALKALAVVARSFALTKSDRHGAEGLCDSTHCQAARMTAVPARIHDAVVATAGETLWSGGRQVDGYFTQNCGGKTDDAADVWGGAKKPWLRTHPDPYCQRQPAQWHATVTIDELRGAMETEGFRFSDPVVGVRVVSRDSSGRVQKTAMQGAEHQVVIAASAMRFAVNRELGWNRLRSDWYTVHMSGRDVVFDGRGFGHGVGLCQAGASEMAREGKHYRDILAFYFAGAQVRVTFRDEGWRALEANGWSVRSTSSDAELLREGNEAWGRARQAWGTQTTVHPVVTIAPDTELFRQLTNEPGWVLASTRGQSITLQSLTLVKAHRAASDLLLHEFLHAVAESESSAAAPLWLREGLVEVLTGEKGMSQALTAAATERLLRNAQSLREAQMAHRAAGAIVQRLVAEYGLPSVRGWLRGGVPASVLAGQ